MAKRKANKDAMTPPEAWVEVVAKVHGAAAPVIELASSAGRAAYRNIEAFEPLCSEVEGVGALILLSDDYADDDATGVATTLWELAVEHFLATRAEATGLPPVSGRLRIRVRDGEAVVASHGTSVSRADFGFGAPVTTTEPGADDRALEMNCRALGSQLVQLTREFGAHLERERAAMAQDRRELKEILQSVADYRVAVAESLSLPPPSLLDTEAGTMLAATVCEAIPQLLELAKVFATAAKK